MLPGVQFVTLLRHTAAGIAALALEGTLGVRLAEQLVHTTGRRPSPSEIRSWERSLPVLAQDLLQAGLERVEMLLEHRMPLTSKRPDVVLAGQHPRTGGPSYVVVELKQWTQGVPVQGSEDLIVFPGDSRRPRLHPVSQVRAYCRHMVDFTKSLQGRDDAVAGVAYLHNATDAGVYELFDAPQDLYGRLFTGQRRADFVEYLRARLDGSVDGAVYADELLTSAAAPSRQLLAVAAAEIQDREQFVLLDEQQVAYSTVLHAVEQARRADRKSIVIVTGGPGTGKSVIALSLLGELARQGRTVLHATGSKSFTLTLRKVAGRRSPRTANLFKFFNHFVDADPNDLDVLILDEAHRIRETSESRYTAASRRSGRPQIDELIAAARVPVFLLDENQVVRPGEMGTVADIEAYAGQLGIPTYRIDLNAQFRCGGSEYYGTWVRRLLGIEQGGPLPWIEDPLFELRVADSPREMEAVLETKIDAGYSGRMAAGFCWPWSNPLKDGSLVNDVVIDGWSRPWNLRSDRAVGGAPPSPLWATDPAGFGQVGCVYTAQGFEYDWNGVIIGPDLVWREDRWATDRAATRDPNLKNSAKVSDDEFSRLIRNVYKVLLTRGMVGTVLYSTDAETRAALSVLVSGGTLLGAKAR